MLRRYQKIMAALLLGACAGANVTSSSASVLDATGGGEMLLVLTYADGQTPATLLTPGCAPTAFTVDGGSQVVMVSLTAVTDAGGVYDYTGPLDVTGSGSSCEGMVDVLNGTMTVSMTSPDGGVGMSCPSMLGGFVRVARVEAVELDGSCQIQGVAVHLSLVTVSLYEIWQGDGVTTPVTQAALRGVVTTSV